MGASNFDHAVYTTQSMQEAYQAARAQAVEEYGYDPYNGTISTTNGVIASPLSSTPVRMDRVDWDAISNRLDHLQKWENCEALPIKEVRHAQFRQVGVVQIEARVPSAIFDNDVDQGDRRAEIQKVFLRSVRKALKAGEALPRLCAAWGQEVAGAVTAEGVDLAALEVRSLSVTPTEQGQRASTQATNGKVETRYFVLREGQREMPRWEYGLSSQAEARTYLPKTLTHPAQFSSERYEIISMSRRVSGEPLVTHEVSLDGRGKTVPVRIKGELVECTEQAEETGRTGWLFYGWAAE